MALFSVLVFHGVLHTVVKTSQKACTECRLAYHVTSVVVLNAGFHRAFKGNDGVSARLYLLLNPIDNGIHFQSQHQLLGVVVCLACKGDVLNTHLVRAFLHIGTAGCERQLRIQRVNHGLYIVLLEFDNGIERHNGFVVVLSRPLHQFGVVYRFPIGANIAHVALTAYHLTAFGQGTAHDFLQRDTASRNNGDKFVRLHVGFAHGGTHGVHRHGVGSLGKGRTCECHTSDTARIHSLCISRLTARVCAYNAADKCAYIAVPCCRVALVKE